MTLLWLSLLTASAAAETAPACWMPSELAYHKGDERVQKAAARIAPPQRVLAAYSPTAQRGVIRRVTLTGDKKLVASHSIFASSLRKLRALRLARWFFCAQPPSRPRSSWAESECFPPPNAGTS